MLKNILSRYRLEGSSLKVTRYGSGLINHTWKVSFAGQEFILQKINDAVFKNPRDIASNIKQVSNELRNRYPDYFFITPIETPEGEQMVFDDEQGYFRLFPFVAGSHTINVVESPQQAYEAALQFGRFTRLLSPADTHLLRPTIPSFHDLLFRYQQFLAQVKNGNEKRIYVAKQLIEALVHHSWIVKQFEALKLMPEFKLRVMHHDTKISNILFDKDERGICVIDLDTIMPGYFISDVGDMMRTYLSPVNEDETDLEKIEIRDEIYRAILEGYSNEMNSVLTEPEKRSFFFAGCFMIYMQALRFLTDYLDNDNYYRCNYENQNYDRANNQYALLQKFLLKKALFEQIKFW